MWTNRISRAIRTAREAEGVSRAAISPDGKWLAVPHGPVAGVSLYEVATGSRAFGFASPDGDVTALSFSPDGRSLAGGTSAGSILLWRLLGPGPPARGALTGEQRGRLWSDLGSGDPARAFRAVRALGGAADAVPLLARRLRSLPPPVTRGRLARLIADLDSDAFAARRRATEELDRLGAIAEPAMRDALASKPSVEAAHRLERLLRRAAAARPPAEHLRVLRAVAVLELVGSPQALRLLDGLARHSPHPAVRSEARAARDRLLRFR
jgi:hypothetical protein